MRRVRRRHRRRKDSYRGRGRLGFWLRRPWIGLQELRPIENSGMVPLVEVVVVVENRISTFGRILKEPFWRNWRSKCPCRLPVAGSTNNASVAKE